MNGYKILALVFISLLVAVLLASALNGFTRVADNALAEIAPTSAPRANALNPVAIPTAKRDYLPIVLMNLPTGVNCIYTTNGIAGGTVCSGDITLQLTAGGVINSASGFGLRANNSSPNAGTAGLYGRQGSGGGGVGGAAGVWGDTDNSYGVLGTSGTGGGVGVKGAGSTGVDGSSSSLGVMGTCTSGSAVCQGVWGWSYSPNGAGVLAKGSGPSGISLQIESGAIKVSGAGISTTTPVFIHVTTAGNTVNNYTTISHTLTNGDSSAILIVTPNYTAGSVYANFPIGVWYSAGKWTIFNQNGALSTMPVGAAFNVLIVKP